jgi:hypothetical protein
MTAKYIAPVAIRKTPPRSHILLESRTLSNNPISKARTHIAQGLNPSTPARTTVISGSDSLPASTSPSHGRLTRKDPWSEAVSGSGSECICPDRIVPTGSAQGASLQRAIISRYLASEIPPPRKPISWSPPTTTRGTAGRGMPSTRAASRKIASFSRDEPTSISTTRTSATSVPIASSAVRARAQWGQASCQKTITSTPRVSAEMRTGPQTVKSVVRIRTRAPRKCGFRVCMVVFRFETRAVAAEAPASIPVSATSTSLCKWWSSIPDAAGCRMIALTSRHGRYLDRSQRQASSSRRMIAPDNQKEESRNGR